MERTYAIILAGGIGLRLNNKVPKQFLPLGEKPVIAWSMESFASCDEIDHLIAVLPAPCIPQINEIIEAHSIRKILKIVPGGDTRQGSAANALASVPFEDNDIILFHDAARPFIRPETIRECILQTKIHGAAGVYTPVQDTVAEIRDMFVASVPSRKNLYCAQTPQGFRFSVINRSHKAALRNGFSATDDVSLALAAGFNVKMIEGEYSNFKITTDIDYQAACRFALAADKS